jgi:hypothetical protein
MLANGLAQLILLASLVADRTGPWRDLIPPEYQLIFPLALFLINLFVLAFFLYLAGLVVVGAKRARVTDAFVISLLGTVLSTAFFLFIPYRLVALLLAVFTWLLLIKRLYETGWFGAVAVGILAVVVFLVVVTLLALVFGILYIITERFFSFLVLNL